MAVNINGTDVAYPFMDLAEAQVVNDEIEETPIVVLWKAGTDSAFDSRGADGPRQVGSSGVFERVVDGRELTFSAGADGLFEDLETGTIWNLFGEAIEGELEGRKLAPVVSAEHFWFAWSVFKPDTIIWSPGS